MNKFTAEIICAKDLAVAELSGVLTSNLKATIKGMVEENAGDILNEIKRSNQQRQEIISAFRGAPRARIPQATNTSGVQALAHPLDHLIRDTDPFELLELVYSEEHEQDIPPQALPPAVESPSSDESDSDIEDIKPVIINGEACLPGSDPTPLTAFIPRKFRKTAS